MKYKYGKLKYLMVKYEKENINTNEFP